MKGEVELDDLKIKFGGVDTRRVPIAGKFEQGLKTGLRSETETAPHPGTRMGCKEARSGTTRTAPEPALQVLTVLDGWFGKLTTVLGLALLPSASLATITSFASAVA